MVLVKSCLEKDSGKWRVSVGRPGVSVWKDERSWIRDDGWTTIQMYRTPLGHQLLSGYGGGFYVVCVFCHSNNMRENRRLCMYI